MSKVFLKLKTSVAYNLLKSELMKIDPDLQVIGGDGSIQNIHKDLLRCVSSKFYHALEYSKEKGHDIECLGAIKVPGLDKVGLKCLYDLLYKGFHLIDSEKADDVIHRLNNLDLSLSNNNDTKDEWADNMDHSSQCYQRSKKFNEMKEDNLNVIEKSIEAGDGGPHNQLTSVISKEKDNPPNKLKDDDNMNKKFNANQIKDESALTSFNSNCDYEDKDKSLTFPTKKELSAKQNIALKSTSSLNKSINFNNSSNNGNHSAGNDDSNCNNPSSLKRSSEVNEYNTRRRSKPTRSDQFIYTGASSTQTSSIPTTNQEDKQFIKEGQSSKKNLSDEYVLPTASPVEDSPEFSASGRPRRSSSARRQPLSDQYILSSPLSRDNNSEHGRRRSMKLKTPKQEYEIAPSGSTDASWSNRLRIRKRKLSASSSADELATQDSNSLNNIGAVPSSPLPSAITDTPDSSGSIGSRRSSAKLIATATEQVVSSNESDSQPSAISQEDRDIQRITSVIKSFLPHPACFLVEDGNLECFVCGEIFRYRDNWRRHLLEQHFHLTFLCPTCGQKFKRRGKCSEHMLRCR